jgi:hypothetical protein
VVVVREGKNLKGRVLGFVVGTIGRGLLKKALKTPSRPSKPGTARPKSEAHHEPGPRIGGFGIDSSPARFVNTAGCTCIRLLIASIRITM